MQQEVVIQASKTWEFPDIRSCIRYRDLLYVLIRREVLSKYIQTILGPAWYVIQPMLTASLFAVVFSKAGRMPTDGIPALIFYLTGLLSWGYFVKCVETISRALINNAYLFQKIYFPRILVPLSITASKVFTYLVQLGVLLGVIAYYHFKGFFLFVPSWKLLYFPLLLIHTSILALGVGLWISSLTTRYRDFHHFLSFSIQFWMYATPIIYPISMIEGRWRTVLQINPMTPIVESYRTILFHVGGVPAWSMCLSILVTVTLFGSGLILFQRIERKFVDTL